MQRSPLILSEFSIGHKILKCNSDNSLKKSKNYFKFLLPMITAIIITLIFWYFNILGSNFVQNSDPTNLSYLLKDTITIPLAIVGIIFPLILLVITAITSKNPLLVVNYIFDNLKPLETVAILLTSLFFYILLYFCSYSNIINTTVLNLFPLFGLFLILISLFQASLLIIKTSKFLNDNKLYAFISNRVKEELIENVCLEKQSVKILVLFKNILKHYDIQIYDSMPANEAINSEKISKYKDKISYYDYIVSINLIEFNKFKDIVIKSNNNISGIKIPRVRISVDSQIEFYIENELKSELKNINFKIFKFKEIKLKPIFDEFKDAIIDSINKNEESKLEKLYQSYFDFLKNYNEYLYVNHLNCNNIEFLESEDQFRPLKMLCYDLDDILKDSAKSDNDRMIEIYALNLFNMSLNSINFEEYSVLKILIRLMSLIYQYSFNLENDRGKIISIKYLLKMIRCLENLEADSEKKSIIKNKFEEIFRNILKESKMNQDNSIKNNDFDKIKSYIIKKYMKNDFLKEFLEHELSIIK